MVKKFNDYLESISTLCILMDFTIHMDAISMELPVLCFKG